MNTTSDLRNEKSAARGGRRAFALGGAAATLIVLGACIQGPWEFYPENPGTFHGVVLTGYALAGQPLRHVCFEKTLDLDEEKTEAFAFYDSAEVRVTGSFGGVTRTLTLTARIDTPNCFKGDSTALVEKGKAYALEAGIKWDSAGQKVVSELSATAHVPVEFSIHRTATAPSFAKTGGVPANIFSPQFFAELPPRVQETMIKEYGQAYGQLANDTAAQTAYIKANGAKIQKRLLDLLSQDTFTYHEGDTLFYLNGALNTLSHYYSSDRSADVRGVLVTQRFDPESERPVTRFDSPLGFKPDSSEYYFPGDTRRLIFNPDVTSKNGVNLLDSIGVINTWFHTRVNRLYFYGVEQAYAQYINTVIQGDPRTKPLFNVKGGQGVFAGAVPDSFDLYIKVDSLTLAYSTPAVHAASCRKEGWNSSKDCREYYRSYCTANVWASPDCRQDAITACLEADLNGNDTLKAACSPVAVPASQDTAIEHGAELRFCVEEGFPASTRTCESPQSECLQTKGVNACKRDLWNYCLDNDWRPDQCQLGLVSYCHDRPRQSETLCRHADDYCREHPDQTLCK
jgi:hypothetical protein